MKNRIFIKADCQNYASCIKLASDEVINLLGDIAGASGTVIYLEFLIWIVNGYINKSTSVSERRFVYYFWTQSTEIIDLCISICLKVWKKHGMSFLFAVCGGAGCGRVLIQIHRVTELSVKLEWYLQIFHHNTVLHIDWTVRS